MKRQPHGIKNVSEWIDFQKEPSTTEDDFCQVCGLKIDDFEIKKCRDCRRILEKQNDSEEINEKLIDVNKD